MIYVLKSNARGSEPYTPLQFASVGLVQKWKGYDAEQDLAFGTAQELCDNCTSADIRGIATVLTTHGHLPKQHYESDLDRAKSIFKWVKANATPGGKRMEEYDIDNPVHEPVSAPKQVRAPKSDKHNLEAKITVIGENKCKPNSYRHRNRQVVMESPTVGEALKALRALKPPGVANDIDLALKDGVITLGE